MNINRKNLLLPGLTLIILVLALISQKIFFSDAEYRFRTRIFNRNLHEKEKIMEDCLESMRPILAMENHHGSLSENNLFSIADKNRIAILEYVDGRLIYASDNSFDVPLVLTDTLYSKPVVFLQNGWFIPMKVEAGNEKLIGLMRIRTDYGYENDIIKSGFEKDFGAGRGVKMAFSPDNPDFGIYNRSGQYLFSLRFPEVRDNNALMLIPLTLWILFFLTGIFLVTRFCKKISGHTGELISGALLVTVLASLYALILLTGAPKIFFQLELFLPHRFSLNSVIPTLGHLLIFSLFITIITYYYFGIKVPDQKQEKETQKSRSPSERLIFLIPAMALVAGLFLLVNNIFGQLILNSNINFESYKITEIDGFSIAGYASVILLLLFPLYLARKIFSFSLHYRNSILAAATLISSLIPLISLWNSTGGAFPFVIFYLVMIFLVWLSLTRKMGRFVVSGLFSLVMGLWSLAMITSHSREAHKERMKIQAVSFASENDPDAEHLLLDLWPVLKGDSVLSAMMNTGYFDTTSTKNVTDYLRQTYFTGYWRSFNLNVILCRNDDLLRTSSAIGGEQNCFDFFGNRIKRSGHRLTGTEFYFIDSQGGRSYYLGNLNYKQSAASENGLFIELYSDINVLQPGYSEILLDRRYHGYQALRDYSLAKYINGEIVLRTGDFVYDKTDAEYVEEDKEFSYFDAGKYFHTLYRNGNATVIISRPLPSPDDLVISLAYLFAFVFVFFNLIILPVVPIERIRKQGFDFRQKLQISFAAVLLFSGMMTASVVSSFTVKQFRTRHRENLREKLSSVYLDLDARLANERRLSAYWKSNGYNSLNDLLIELSNIFMTDINLYDSRGFLIATSRPEVLYRNLMSRRMNNDAFNNMTHFTRSEYFQMEKIGSLEYLSAYIPFYNTDNQLLAYLNLPYFRMQSILAREISSLAVAVINFTLLLILLTMSLAVIIANRLTSPLSMLMDGLASVGVGKKSEHLSYKGSDEIGELVRQYNLMVDEIEESTRKLADSEREYAWREMAKQIAHEIKNPLTPMKLNVQQLFKSWNDKVPGFDKRIERFTHNQIEYIDNLSSIASAFSSFAKMPAARPSVVNLAEQIRFTMGLFRDSGNVSFQIQWPHEGKLVVFADKEQLNGIFSNLIKNSIQSIPDDRKGIIRIAFQVRNDKVIVSIADNGAGIPEDLQKKIFTPNFTTKSSGMGLGLSIVRKYAENAGGTVWFNSGDGGTVFFVELPLRHDLNENV